MNKLYQNIPMKLWIDIADKIQLLNMSPTQDFKSNLLILRGLLSDLDICLELGNETPQTDIQIGLASLLKSIYNTSDCYAESIKEFCEYIYMLNDLGIQSMKYKPINFPTKMERHLNITKTYSGKAIEECYTDGKFKLSRPSGIINYYGYDCYVITNLKDASYILSADIFHKTPYAFTQPVISESYAIVKDFKGKLPCKKDFLSVDFPKLKIHNKKINWGESPEYSQIFDVYSKDDLNTVKKLTK